MTQTEETQPHYQSKLGESGDRLEAWAAKIDASDDACVRELLDALLSDEDLHAWAEVDIDRCLPVASEKPSQRGIVINGLSLARNVLVFVPIVLAWLGIRSATNGHGKYLARSGSDKSVMFLEYWTDPARGFDRLQNVALMVAIVVGVIIVTTIAIAILEESASRDWIRQKQETERERAYIVLYLRLVLAPRRKVDVQNIEASLTAAIDNFKYSSNQLRDSTTQLGEIFESTEALGPQLERTTERMNDIVVLMQRELSGSITILTGQIRALGAELTGIDSKLGSSLDQRIERVVTMTSGVVKDLDLLGKKLNQICLAAEGSVSRMVALVEPSQYGGRGT